MLDIVLEVGLVSYIPLVIKVQMESKESTSVKPIVSRITKLIQEDHLIMAQTSNPYPTPDDGFKVAVAIYTVFRTQNEAIRFLRKMSSL